MFEFHGWINVQCKENDLETIEQTYIRQNTLCKEIESEIKRISWCNGIFNLHRGINGEDHLLITGSSNHFTQVIEEFLYWLADKKSDSYGIIHTLNHDTNEFNVLRVYKNHVIIMKDDILPFT